MAKKEKELGICRVCKEKRELSFEHIPPKSAFNRSNRHYVIKISEYYENLDDYLSGDKKPDAKIKQGGYGNFCLCVNCNSFLGTKYVHAYNKFAKIGMSIIHSYEHNKAKSFQLDVSDLHLLNFLKQVIAIFVCSNSHTFTNSYPELLNFIKEIETDILPERYRIYMYLSEGRQTENGVVHYTNTGKVICHFSFPPFGFVLDIDSKERIMELSEITGFKHYNKLGNRAKLNLVLNRYSYYSPYFKRKIK